MLSSWQSWVQKRLQSTLHPASSITDTIAASTTTFANDPPIAPHLAIVPIIESTLTLNPVKTQASQSSLATRRARFPGSLQTDAKERRSTLCAADGLIKKTKAVIPYEVLKHILPFCCKSTLSILIVTDHLLSRYVEIQLYHHVTLLTTPVIANQYLNPIPYIAKVLSTHPIYKVLQAIAANPERTSWIKHLEIEVNTDSPLLHPTLALLLQFCRHHLDKLHLKFKQRDNGSDCPWLVPTSFNRLTRLDLTGATDRGLPWVLDILTKAPNVHTLRINTENVTDTDAFINTPQPALLSSYPNIQVLRITHFGRFFPNHLLRLIRNANNIETLVWNQTMTLVNQPGGGRTEGEDPWGVILRKQSLKRLIWSKGTSREFAALVGYRQGFEGLEEVVVGDQDLRGSYPGPKNIHIPKLSNLKAMFIYVDQSPKQKNTHQTALSSVVPTFPWRNPIEIPPAFIEMLSHAPELVSIRIGTSKPLYDRIKPNAESWERTKASGYLIRTYTNGKDDLVILRSRFQNVGYWVMYADFNGGMVSEEKLGKLMEMVDDHYSWKEPGRGLELSEKAWELLRV